MKFQCSHCHEIIEVDNADLGQDVQCGSCFETVTVPSARVMPGTVIADFLIIEEIGRGGMGIVYRAHQISLDRPAAVKILADSYASNSDFITGFIKEARAAAQLNHPHIVQAFAVGEDDGIFYFAMEYVNGETMKAILKREHVIPVPFAINVIQQIAEALDYAWKESKIVHRDIKPDNIMITTTGKAKLADLGLARSAEDVNSEVSDEVMGTPQYISPEQLTGSPVDNRTDIYCLGATFFHLITGRFPFEGNAAVEIAEKHLSEPLTPPHLYNPEIPEMISLVVMKMMAKNPDERYASAMDLIEDLSMVRKGKLPPSLAAKHGGGFAGKTLILVNDRSHVSRPIQAPVPAKKTLLPVIISAIILLVLVVVGITMYLSSSTPVSAPVRVATFTEKADAVYREANAKMHTDIATAHDLLYKFLKSPSLPSTEEDFQKLTEVRNLFAKIDETYIVQKSDYRNQMKKVHTAEFNKIQGTKK